MTQDNAVAFCPEILYAQASDHAFQAPGALGRPGTYRACMSHRGRANGTYKVYMSRALGREAWDWEEPWESPGAPGAPWDIQGVYVPPGYGKWDIQGVYVLSPGEDPGTREGPGKALKPVQRPGTPG